MYLYRLVFLLVVSIYVFSPVIMDWWIDPQFLYRPYIILADLDWALCMAGRTAG